MRGGRVYDPPRLKFVIPSINMTAKGCVGRNI